MLHLVLALICAVVSSCALAQERVALLIGNAEYAHTTRLRNPVNDVDAMRRALERLQFAVTVVTDADEREMGRALRDFRRRAAAADTALLFYSGHGMEIGGENYLIPVDAELEHPDDASTEAIDLDAAVASASGASRLSIVVIDACRNNRFPTAEKDGVRGFVPVRARAGQLLAFATAPGTVAYDGRNDLSPYTQALTEVLARSDVGSIDVRRLFGGLGPRVRALTENRQVPHSNPFDFGLDIVTLTGGEGDVDNPPPEPSSTASAVFDPSSLDDGAVFREPGCADCPEMVVIPGGRFTMGSPAGEGPDHERPQREVTVPRFAMGRYEVTFEEWDACVADGYCRAVENDSWGRGRRPVLASVLARHHQ